MLGSSGAYACFPEKIWKIWCILYVLVYLLIRLCLEKFPQKLTYFYIKKTHFCVNNNYYSTI